MGYKTELHMPLRPLDLLEELRKDPITRSWVRMGRREGLPISDSNCPLCPGRMTGQPTLLEIPAAGAAQVRVVPHFHPLYSIKEVYFNALLPEQAAERLRQLDPRNDPGPKTKTDPNA